MTASSLQTSTPVKLATDADFAPWSFLDQTGKLTGISVEIAAEACRRAALACEISPAGFQALMPSLTAKSVEGIVVGPRLTEDLATQYALTRPYYRSFGRFVMRNGTPITGPDIRSLAGLRLGFVENAAHGRFLKTYYSRSALTGFKDSAAMLEALRTGQLDVAFGDAVAMAFWLKGDQSKGCCSFLGRSFLHKDSFTRPLSLVLSRDNPLLRERLDAALDQMESDGTTATILARYLPGWVW